MIFSEYWSEFEPSPRTAIRFSSTMARLANTEREREDSFRDSSVRALGPKNMFTVYAVRQKQKIMTNAISRGESHRSVRHSSAPISLHVWRVIDERFARDECTSSSSFSRVSPESIRARLKICELAGQVNSLRTVFLRESLSKRVSLRESFLQAPARVPSAREETM